MENISKRLEHYGDADIHNISMLKLIYKYGPYCAEQSDLRKLDKDVSLLQRTDSDICMEYLASKGYVSNSSIVVVDTGDFSNNAPTLSGITLEVSAEGYYITRDTLLQNYSDPERTAASMIEIKSIPANGELYFNGSLVTVGQVINVSQNVYLTYVRNNNAAFSTSFNYSAYDNHPQVPLESNTVSATLNCLEIVPENQPATVGDTSLYVDNREVMVFTLADFTSLADPQYFDPEGDNLDAIRIDKVSNTNEGEFLLYGTPVVVNQVISASEISSGAFVYTAPNINSIKTDVIEVSIRDTGSMQWVQ